MINGKAMARSGDRAARTVAGRAAPKRVLLRALIVAIGLPLLAPTAAGQTGPGEQAASPPAVDAAADTGDRPSADDRAEAYRKDLEAIAAQKAESEAKQRALKNEIARLKSDQANVGSALVRSADQLRELRKSIDDGVRRLQELLETESGLRDSLVARRAELAGVLAALQRIGRHPPPAIAARPSDALGAIRSAILMGAVMPQIRDQTESLQRDLAALQTLKAEIHRERSGLEADAERFAEENARLELLLEEKRRLRSKSEMALASERKRAAELAAEAKSLNDLIAELDADIKARRKAEAAAARQGVAPAPEDGPPAGLYQSVPFAEAMGTLRFPADGVKVRGFGEDDSLGGRTTGLSLRVAAEGRVYAPADARVSYAGPFRSYGQVLILDAGEGYHVVLSGMERIDVARDQYVLAGEPVGRMGTSRYASAGTIDIHSSDPVLYIEFRKDGRAIDPSPWWATPGAEKVGG